MTDLSYSASITRASGVAIYVTIEAPADTSDADELSEVAQMAAHHASGIVRRSEEYRAKRAAQEAIEAKFGKVPF